VEKAVPKVVKAGRGAERAGTIGGMGSRTRKAVVVIGAVLGAAACVALGVFLQRQGLDRADKFASVFGLFVGLAGLSYAVFGNRGGAGDAPAGIRQNNTGGVNIANSGTLGDVHVRDREP
jgi:hypothetical protein